MGMDHRRPFAAQAEILEGTPAQDREPIGVVHIVAAVVSVEPLALVKLRRVDEDRVNPLAKRLTDKADGLLASAEIEDCVGHGGGALSRLRRVAVPRA